MLRIPCPQCRDPLYLLPDESMFCVTCNSFVVKEETLENANKTENVSKDPIKNKIEQLSKQLDQETDPEKILNLATIIKKLQQI